MQWTSLINLPIRSEPSFKRYASLIQSAQSKPRKRGSVYLERHHCWPKSHGGTNDSWNLVYLTAREHFLAHWLLWKALRTRFMANAFNNMTFLTGDVGNVSRQFRITSRAFESARIAASVNSKELWKSQEMRDRQRAVALSMGLGQGPRTARQLAQAREQAKVLHSDPDIQAKKSESISKLVWINKGGSNKRVNKGSLSQFTSDGWVVGRHLSESSKAAMTRGLLQNV